MHRPIRLAVALIVAATVSLAPSLAFGAGGTPSDEGDADRPLTSTTRSLSPTSLSAESTSDSPPSGVDSAETPTAAGTPDGPISDTATEMRPDQLARDGVRLGCETALRGDVHGVACKWGEAQSPQAAGYRLWRAVDVPNPDDHRHIIARGGLDFRAEFDTDISAGHTYHYAVEIVDARGHTLGWSPTVRVATVRNETLTLACKGVDTDRASGVACEWSESNHPGFAGYRLVRSDGQVRTTVFETRDVLETRSFDDAVRRGVRYDYAVLVVDAHGHEIGRSATSTAGLAALPDEKLRLGCALTSDGDVRGIACKWEEATHAHARGYVLYRSVDGDARQELFRTGIDGPNRFFDSRVEAGHRYTYAVVLLDREGGVIGQGGPVTVAVPRPQPTPEPADPKPTDARDPGR